ncbi:hypothetical protein LJR225_003779 [Phenylobacterium sp. LjRoot225]
MGRQAADLAVAALDDRQNHHVGRAIGLDHLLFQRAVLEEPPHRLPAFARHVRAARGRSAERRHQREVVGERDQSPISVDVATHERGIRVRGSPHEFGDRLVNYGAFVRLD